MIQMVQEAALKGGEVLRKYFRKEFELKQKTSHQNLVTTADFESQRVITNYLEIEMVKKYKIDPTEIGFIGEEGLYKSGKYTFVIDPVDGTSNFATGFEYFSVSIALFVDGILKYGVVYQPINDKMYFAEKSKGAFLKEKGKLYKLVSRSIELKDLYLSVGFKLDKQKRNNYFQIYDRLYNYFRGYMYLNSAALSICLVAENVIGLLIGRCSIWDISAAQVILEEVGGIIVDRVGKPFSYDLKNYDTQYPFLACHKKNLPKILQIMK